MTSRTFTMQQSWARPAAIGFLGATNPAIWGPFIAAFEGRLREHNWFVGRNIVIDYEWAHGRNENYALIAQRFVDSEVDVIVTSGTAPTIAAKKATTTIPIVFAAAGDPKKTNLAKAAAKVKHSNVTGLSNGQTRLAAKRLSLLHKMLPHMETVALLGNFNSANVPLEAAQVRRHARRLGIRTIDCDVDKGSQIAPAIRALHGKADALFVCTDPLITTNAVTINISAACAELPTMHAFRNYVQSGGLMSYGPDFHKMFVKAASLVDKILRREHPYDLPVQEEAQAELVINQNTARALGVNIPRALRRSAIVI